MKQFLAILPVALLCAGCSASQPEIVSPDGRIAVRVRQDSTTMFVIERIDGNKPDALFSLSATGVTVNDSIKTGERLSFCDMSANRKDEYRMVTGKRKSCSNVYNEYRFKDNDNRMTMALRLYNDGIAFRYFSDNQSAITGETTRYATDPADKRWMQKYDPSYEQFFPEQTGHGQQDSAWGYPALVEFNDSTWGLFTEAGVERYNCSSWLASTGRDGEYAVEWGSEAKCPETPWRVIIIGSLADVVESTLVTDVSPESRVDASWIEPGVASWIYWAHNHGSKDFKILKQYVDLADTLHLPYTLIDAEWDGMSNGGDINDVIAYAASKNVKPMIWYNSTTGWIDGAPGPKYRLNKPEDREKEFEWLEKSGVAGVKIDFFAGDTQQTMEYYIDLLECAARHHLLVNFHGATVPRGWQRTYPHLMSTEGVYGAEWYNNAPVLTDRAAAHNATLPFTRNAIGSMDYTPCTFSDSQHPHITTHAHELALTALFESGIQHLADRPESYLAQPQEVREFLSTLPSAWDDTQLISGYPGNHAVMARRAGDSWYIAGINGTDSIMQIALDYSRLNAPKMVNATMFADSDDADNPWEISSLTALPAEVTLQPRGGFVIKF